MKESPGQDSKADQDPWNGSLSVAAAVATLGLCCLYGYVTPSFRVMFEDLGQELPRFTQVVISFPLVAWIVSGAALSLVLLSKNIFVGARGRAWIDITALVVCAISVPVMCLALFGPLNVIIHSIK